MAADRQPHAQLDTSLRFRPRRAAFNGHFNCECRLRLGRSRLADSTPQHCLRTRSQTASIPAATPTTDIPTTHPAKCPPAPKTRTPFGAGRAAVPPRIPRIRQFGANDPVRQFLFGPTKRPGFKPPLVTALDLDGNNLIDADELLNDSEALQRLDANGDGKIGPAEWAPRPGVGTNIFLPDNRGKGKQPGRPTVGEGRPGTSAKSDAKSEKAREKKRKRDRATKTGRPPRQMRNTDSSRIVVHVRPRENRSFRVTRISL